MIKKKCLPSLLLIPTLLLAGCGKADGEALDHSGSTLENEQLQVSDDYSEKFSELDFEVGYDESESALILLNGDRAECSSDAVRIEGSTVTIIDEGTYILTGSLDDGMIIVDSDKTDKTRLILDNVSIHSETCAPIYILQADKVFITMISGSTNTLTNGGSFELIDENNIDGVIFSKEDLTLNGSGLLIITSPAGHGIVSKDSLTLTGGVYDINCSAHALAGKDEISIANAELNIVSGKDGIHAENSDDGSSGLVYIQSGAFSINSEGDGISASAYMQIDGGSFNIVTGGGSGNAMSKSSASWGGFMGGGRHQGGGMGSSGSGDGYGSETGGDGEESDSTSIKGVKSGADLIINGGEFTVNSADDSVHSNASLTVNGGAFEIASGDDAFHAEDTLTVTAGEIDISESYEGLESLHIYISGGNIRLVSHDDGLNAAGGIDASGFGGGRDAMFGGGMNSGSKGSITITGGTIHITAYGDGIDANGTLEIQGGFITVCGPTHGDTSTLDYDAGATISGGTFIGTGASNMVQTFSDSRQGVISVSVGNRSAGTEIILTDSCGNTIIQYTAGLDYAVVILSSPEIIKGESYTFSIGSDSMDFTAH